MPRNGNVKKPLYDKTKAAGKGAAAATPVVTLIAYMISKSAPGLPTEVTLALAVLVASAITGAVAFGSAYMTTETKNRS